MSEYHCLIAGLPDLHIGEKNKGVDLQSFVGELKESLSTSDYEFIRLFLLKIDNQNLIQFLDHPELEFTQTGNYTREQVAEFVLRIKEDENVSKLGVPDYFSTYILAVQADQLNVHNMLKEDQLNSLYYNYALQCKNKFIRDWFEFNMNLYNILTAITCRKYKLDYKNYLVGDNEVCRTIKENTSRDFGLTGIFDYLEPLFRLSDERSIYDREKKIDTLRWQYLDDQVFFHYFTIERIFTYMIMIETIDRWSKLSSEQGEQIFREFIKQLQSSFEFPSMFMLNK